MVYLLPKNTPHATSDVSDSRCNSPARQTHAPGTMDPRPRGSWQMSPGTTPVSWLCATFSCSSFRIRRISPGSDPRSLLKLTSNTVNSVRFPICGVRQSVRLSFIRISSFKVPPIFPMLAGIHPPKLLFARTKTETGELPRLAGRLNRNRSLLKTSGGTGPSNSLNRRSRNFRDVMFSTTDGKPPTNRLLLRSSSKRSRSLPKVLGTTPQNLLELRWNKARSVSRPISGGREPAMSAWLRSMPATTVSDSFAGEGAQKIPLYEHTLGPLQFLVVLSGSEWMFFFKACRAMYARRRFRFWKM
ncbi:Ig kappa chain V-VI region NQ2-6.1 [Striga asiatica]|uniref:Ig kappa chain V-VI region NQ2-6.1 n=1 Tax=Striga asiatica TaxID=4170 RepID=A0A5A7QAI1_STRAF|nr:Ig kappa chain V-VI region NQ2-6.1 [Striga asiatica]